MNIVNLTPHAIGLFTENEELITTCMPYETTLRLESEEQTSVGNMEYYKHSIPIVNPPSFKPFEWPEIDCDAVIVSMPIGLMAREGNPPPPYIVFGPDTGPENVVRENGRIVGTKRFIQYSLPVKK